MSRVDVEAGACGFQCAAPRPLEIEATRHFHLPGAYPLYVQQHLAELKEKAAAQKAVLREDFLLTDRISKDLQSTRWKKHGSTICNICFIEFPSKYAQKSLVETWYGDQGRCGHCGRTQATPKTEEKRALASDASLGHRVVFEAEAATHFFCDKISGKQKNAFMKELKNLRDEKEKVGCGRGIREGRGARSYEKAALVCQLVRTMHRTSMEPQFSRHAKLISCVLQNMGAW